THPAPDRRTYHRNFAQFDRLRPLEKAPAAGVMAIQKYLGPPTVLTRAGAYLPCWRATVKILVLTNLYPPHHAGTYNFRVQAITETLQLRGHTIQVLTSKHGMTNEQRGGQVERRLLLNGVLEHPVVSRLGGLR